MQLQNLQSVLGAAQLGLEQDPGDPMLQTQVAEARDALTSFCSTKARWVDSVIQARWMADGDKSTKLFHKTFRSLAVAKTIPELTTPSGTTTNSWEEMATTVTGFFTNILGNPPQGARQGIDPVALHKILHHQSDRLVPSEKESLNAPLTLDELGEATKALVNEKCLGSNGAQLSFTRQIGIR